MGYRFRPFRERKLDFSKLLIRSRGDIKYVEHTEGNGEKLFEAVSDLRLEGIVSKRLTSVYRSGPIANLDQSQKSESACGNSRY